jgi:hypothetical protein
VRQKANRKKKLKAQVLELMQTKGTGGALHRQWLSVALAYFHGLPRKVGLEAERQQNYVVVDDGVSIDFKGFSYWIPNRRSG